MLRYRIAVIPSALVPFATSGELMVGVYRAIDLMKERDRILATLGAARVIYPMVHTVDACARVTAALQRLGHAISSNDLWNAAIALERNLPLLTDDAHLARMPRLKLLRVR